MPLENIIVKGYKSFKSIDVKLSGINVVIGANGSGKSNFLKFFKFVKDKINNDKVITPENMDKYFHCGTKQTEKIEYDLKFICDDISNNYKVELGLNEEREMFLNMKLFLITRIII